MPFYTETNKHFVTIFLTQTHQKNSYRNAVRRVERIHLLKTCLVQRVKETEHKKLKIMDFALKVYVDLYKI